MVEPAAGPGLLRRCVANALALGVGAGVSWLGGAVTIWLLGGSPLLGFAAAAIVWGSGSFVGVAARDALLRRWGARLPPARTPRGFRGILAWGGGFLAAIASIVAIALIGFAMDLTLPETGRVAAFISVLTAPTVGVLATRGLCRRWAAPPSSLPPTPDQSPAPAPAPLPARPADDLPSSRFLPSPA